MPTHLLLAGFRINRSCCHQESAIRAAVLTLARPWETISSTPLGRNHVLLATWTLSYWTLLLATRWIQGEAVWAGPSRWLMAGLAILGSVLLGITGTLGGHLVGIYTDVAGALRFLGWEVYTTFYVPMVTLIVIGVITLLLIGLGFRERTTRNAG